LKAAINGIIFALGEQLLPLFASLFKGMATWIAENRKLVILLAKVAAGIGVIILVATAAIAVISALGLAWAFLNSQIFLVPAAIALAIAAVVAWIAILTLLVQDFIAFTQGKDSVFGRFIEGIKTLATILAENLVNAFASAWAIIKEHALEVWMSIISRMQEMWQSFVETRLDPILRVFEQIQKVIGLASPGAAITRGAARLAAPVAQAIAGPTTMDVDIAVAPPQGTSARGVAQAVASAFRAGLNQLTMGRTGLGR
jgi:hypothetical protein